MSFIISCNRHTCQFERLKTRQTVLLYRPYTRNLHLESYKNVVLTAKGINIIRVLPYIFHITIRKRHDNQIRRELKDISTIEKELESKKEDLIKKKKQISLKSVNTTMLNIEIEVEDLLSQKA